ncbi:alpha/beta hydrolase [Pantanalinema rosaneae CENA516]|uniref:alpha/beta hydrolase n=1 Tax=Pantanalinema rosaneae TaxID=1620701 RepID=UPI003D6FD109
MLGLLLVVVLASCSRPTFVALSGYVPGYVADQDVNTWQQVGQTTIDYVIKAPTGTAPASGWSVIVALHPAGGNGQGMIQAFQRLPNPVNALILAPTITDQAGMTYDAAAIITHTILEKVKAEYPINPQQIIVFGYSQGGAIASVYAQRYPEAVAGVAIAAAPVFAYPRNSVPNLKYAIGVGENDPRKEPATTFVNELKQRRYPVEFEVIPGTGHEFTPQYFDMVLSLVSNV